MVGLDVLCARGGGEEAEESCESSPDPSGVKRDVAVRACAGGETVDPDPARSAPLDVGENVPDTPGPGSVPGRGSFLCVGEVCAVSLNPS